MDDRGEVDSGDVDTAKVNTPEADGFGLVNGLWLSVLAGTGSFFFVLIVGSVILMAAFGGSTDDAAAAISRAFGGWVRAVPVGHTHLLQGVDFGIGPSHEVVIAGDPDSEDTQAMLRALRSKFVPNKVVLLKQSGGELDKLAPFAAGMGPLDGKPAAYICVNYARELPTTDRDEALKLLTR